MIKCIVYGLNNGIITMEAEKIRIKLQDKQMTILQNHIPIIGVGELLSLDNLVLNKIGAFVFEKNKLEFFA